MKIHDIKHTPLSIHKDQADLKNTHADAHKSSINIQGDSSPVASVTLSTMASQLKSLETAIAAEDVYDAEKVESIKNAIRDGHFKVNSEKVADGLIATVQALIHQTVI